MDAPAGLLSGRYRLVRRVGSGGMGVVWEAWDERLHRTVAVKQLHAQPGLSDAERQLANERAMREARITARLDHPNAVPVFDVVEHDGQPCLIMQFLPSEPLSVVLRERKRLPFDEVARIGAQVASALAAAHRLGIVHRDVKPGNILLAHDGTARISDFGISHALGDVTLTSTGMVHGTPAYLAPEIARGGESSNSSDVFGLGATLYAAVEGAPPFGTDANSIALLYRVATGDFNPPDPEGPLSGLLTLMLSADPEQRPSMSDVAYALGGITKGGSAADADSTTRVSPSPWSTTVIRPTPWTSPAAGGSTAVSPEASGAASAAAGGSTGGSAAGGLAAGAAAAGAGAGGAAAADLGAGAGASGVGGAAGSGGATGGGAGGRSVGGGSRDVAEPTSVLSPASAGSAPPSPPSPGSGPSWVSAQPSQQTRRRPLGGAVKLLLALAVLLGLGALAFAVVPGLIGDPSIRDGAVPANPATPSPAATSASRSTPSASSTPPPSVTRSPSPSPSSAAPSRTPTTRSPSPTRSSTSASPTTPATGDATAAELSRAISDYYGALPGDTDAGWSRLTGDYRSGQAGGRRSYDRFWGGFERVSVSGVRGLPPDGAEATITYVGKNGSVERERRSFELVREGGQLRIDESEVLG